MAFQRKFFSFVFFLKFSKVILQTFYYFSFHLPRRIKKKLRKKKQFVVYKYLSFIYFLFPKVVIYFVIFFTRFFVFLQLQNFSLPKTFNISENWKNFSSFHFPSSPIMDDFQWLRSRKEGRKNFPRENEIFPVE